MNSGGKGKKGDAALAPLFSVESAAAKLSAAVAIPTVSHADHSRIDLGQYRRFHSFLRRSFPLVHRHMECRAFGDYALLYYWKGSDPGLRPFLLAAHYDVVPASDDETGWEHGPFSGYNDGQYVWGRGTLDIKMSLVTMLEAAESLITGGFRPLRGMYFAFGGDEEIDGREGAGAIAAYLQAGGVALEYVLDEGTVISRGLHGGPETALALVSIAEKGHCNLDLSVTTRAGHASLPHRHTALGILCRAVARIESRPFPARLTEAVELFLRGLARHSPWPSRFVLSRPRLFWPLLRPLLASKNTSNAMIRTSQAATMMRGSEKENVLPSNATATINVRILPGESVATVMDRIIKIVGDPRVTVRENPSWRSNGPVSGARVDSFGYAAIAAALGEAAPGVPVLPFLLSGSTDSKHYAALTRDIYRFTPVILDEDGIARIHGAGERISMDNIARCLSFYRSLIVGSALTETHSR
jgi:carboxypeptidase PM20D1